MLFDNNNDTLSEFDNHPIPHVMQDTNWNCGLACVVMTIRGLGFSCSLRDITRQCPVNSQSIWTIDLAYLLRNYVQDFTYYTSYLGSRKEYQEQKFYQDSFNQDEGRVNKLFATAKGWSIHVVRMKLPLNDYKRFLYCKKFAIITLVNAHLLKCQLCKKHTGCLGNICNRIDLLFEKFKGYHYLGHYIVFIGYDPNNDIFIYRDPAVTDKFCTISADDLDLARQADGTDNDCIVVKL